MGKIITKRISAKEAYLEYGFNHYQCIDMEGEHQALKFDLGLSLKEHYGFKETFDLVTIKEIGHWIFDQKTLWENIHNSCKVGGHIIWRSPVVGGFSAGCFAFIPNKMLQIAFCNEYIYKGAWIYRENTCIENGQYGSWSQESYYRFESFKAKDFLALLDKYMQANLWSKKEGKPIYRLTLVFEKTKDTLFKVPYFPYVPLREAMARNNKSILKNCFPKLPRQKVAIFGAKEAAKLAYYFCQSANLEVVCFVDDFIKGEFLEKPIVGFEEFIWKYQEECDVLIKGPYQKGELEQRKEIKVEIIQLMMEWFV